MSLSLTVFLGICLSNLNISIVNSKSNYLFNVDANHASQFVITFFHFRTGKFCDKCVVLPGRWYAILNWNLKTFLNNMELCIRKVPKHFKKLISYENNSKFRNHFFLLGCANGFCRKPYECHCNEGWEGILCDQRNQKTSNFLVLFAITLFNRFIVILHRFYLH